MDQERDRSMVDALEAAQPGDHKAGRAVRIRMDELFREVARLGTVVQYLRDELSTAVTEFEAKRLRKQAEFAAAELARLRSRAEAAEEGEARLRDDLTDMEETCSAMRAAVSHGEKAERELFRVRSLSVVEFVGERLAAGALSTIGPKWARLVTGFAGGDS